MSRQAFDWLSLAVVHRHGRQNEMGRSADGNVLGRQDNGEQEAQLQQHLQVCNLPRSKDPDEEWSSEQGRYDANGNLGRSERDAR